MIEDPLIGKETAHRVGIQVFTVYAPYSAHEPDLIKTKTDYFVQDVTELLRYIS